MIKEIAIRCHLAVFFVCLFCSQIIAADTEWRSNVPEAIEAIRVQGDAEEGKDVYSICIPCHTPKAWGTQDGTFPQLAGQHKTVLIKQITDIRVGHRKHPTMNPFAAQLSGTQEIADVASYIRTLKTNPTLSTGPGGVLYILTNNRREISTNTFKALKEKIGAIAYKKLKKLKNREFSSKATFITALKDTIGLDDARRFQAIILTNADWSTDLTLGKVLFERECVTCHGGRGQGNQENFYPVIAGQTYLYITRQFNWIRTGLRLNANPKMVKKIKNFNDFEMRSVTDYVSRFRPDLGD